MSQPTHLRRSLTLTQATAVNVIDMVGIGPFITLSAVAGIMHGPASMWAWLLGAVLAFVDGAVWAEMGAKWPEAGGSYAFLQKLFGREKGGRLMSFLFVWQTSLQAPLVVASAAIGFAHYFTFLIPIDEHGRRALAGGLVIAMIALLYRDIKSIGRLSVVLWIITGGTIIWLILSGVPRFSAAQAFDISPKGFDGSVLLFAALGNASTQAIYSYLGYYNVCHLGAEIQKPERNIPRAIFLSIAIIAVLYLGMQTVVNGVLPASQIAESKFVVSEYFEAIYNHRVAQVATGLVLVIALSSLFSVLLGYSRIPYAAAVQGDYFSFFAKLHPTKAFPHRSLLLLGGLGFLLSVIFTEKPTFVIKAIITMRILVQFVSQAVGVMWWRYKAPADARPWKMPLYPLPAVLSIGIWLFILFSSDVWYIVGSLVVIGLGVAVYYAVLHRRNVGR